MPVTFLDLKREPPIDSAVIARVLDSGRFIGGPEVSAFETAFAEYCGASCCVSVANGTDAIEISLRAAGVKAGDEVATVANAGMYATTAIRAIGAIPLYVDIDPTTLLMSPARLVDAVGSSTRAVVVTHLYGRMARMQEFVAFCNARGLILIEDCAQAHGATLDGKRAGTWGLAGCYSFYPTKNLGAYGDAGAIVTSDPSYAARIRKLKEYGWARRFHSELAGGRNSRMDEIQAAILSAKLPLLDSRNQRRMQIADRYSEVLGGCDFLEVSAPGGDSYVAHLYVVRCGHRDALRQWLAARGVPTEIHYPIPDHRQLSQSGLPSRAVGLEETERASREILSLPCYPELREDEFNFVVEGILGWRR